VQFVVSMKKDIATVRLGKRFRVTKCPSREFAETLTLALNTTIQTQTEKVKQIFDLLTQRCEQLEIDFNKPEGKPSDDIQTK
jgi:hypothetical protein